MARAGQAASHESGWRLWMPLAAVALFAAFLLSPLSASWRNSLADDRPFAAAYARGKLIVAVPSQPAPILTVGHVDRSVRAPEAYSAALAEALGRRAGLPVELVLAEQADARHAVQDGRADVAIAGLAFSPDASVAFAPGNYASGRGVALVLRHGDIQDWRDLEGRSICASRESPFAARAAHRYRAALQSFDRPLDALLAFQAGECAALVDDELVVRALLKQADWSYYRTLPGAVAPAPAFIASRGGDIASAAFIERTVNGWRRERWFTTVRQDQATRLAFEMFNAQNDLYCH
ncbi:transporter substrate-binding domain-containing protein [Caballeronia sp. GAWG1-1]|uniref:substrate-binding periplasmic protein n=1 Tax=Caballeronia sp. GAWG1-1 TaxID=2921742 RepID=UPI0020281EE2|nr:transporter substrate-binding domain-containing protein [Caballeronia sp. GAWG1-1]